MLIAVPAARADGDPASDYLLGQPSFIPPDAGVPSGYANQLDQTLAEAKAAGFETRVALVASRYDMGSVGVLFKQPKRYARFLGEELSFVYRGRLIVVMPNGIGVSRNGRRSPTEQAIADRLPAPGPSGAGLASTATRLTARIATESGTPVTIPPLAGATSSPNPNRDRLMIAGVVLLVLVALGAWRYLRGRWLRGTA